MARSAELTVNLHTKIVKVTATVELRTDDGNVVATTEVDLTPTVEAEPASV